MKSSAMVMILCGLSLSACGSGGGTSDSPAMVATAEAPRPLALAKAAAAPVYQTYAGLTGDQHFQTACARLVDLSDAFGEGGPLDYTESSDSYTIGNLAGSSSISFGPADVKKGSSPPGTERNYLKSDRNFLIITRAAPGTVKLDYSRHLESSYGRCVFGVPTLVSDLSTTGTVTYSKTGIAGSATGFPFSTAPTQTATLDTSTLTASADFAAGTVTVSFVLRADQPNFGPRTLGSFTGTAIIDRVNGSYSGSLVRSDGAATRSTFSGWFFGPQAQEMGFVLSTADRDDNGVFQATGIGFATK